MPNVGDRGHKPKPKKKSTRTSPRKKRDEEGEDSFGESDGGTDPNQEAQVDTDSDRGRQGRPGVEDRQGVEEKIAQFFEARPYFYDISHEHYKNRQKKDSQLVSQFAATIDWDGE